MGELVGATPEAWVLRDEQQQAASGRERSADLPQCSVIILEMLEHVEGAHEIEATYGLESL